MDRDLNPTTISLPTFKALLSSYETTVKTITRSKALAKASSSKGKKQSQKQKKTQGKKRAADSDRNDEEEEGEHEQEHGLSQDAKKQVDAQVREFETLDSWRYKSLPGLVEARIQGKAKTDGEGGGGGGGKEPYALSKDEVVKLMEWKLYVFLRLPHHLPSLISRYN